jgi:hypothetical protein
MFELFSHPNCPVAETTVRLLETQELPFQVFHVNSEITEWELHEQFPFSDTLPIITKDGMMIGSTLNLVSHLRSEIVWQRL